ncbi:MAG TPA: hypothetical protein VL989_03235 [Candidatus Sulfotelmatobacter sp.]|nr:hypothetical protein [Candidatus Sulfotelmatobacter sp.]
MYGSVFDLRILLPVIVVLIFCFSYIGVRSHRGDSYATVNSMTSKQASYSKASGLDALKVIAVPDDGVSVSSSGTTASLQNTPSSSSTNSTSPSQGNATTDNSPLQASKTTGNPDNFNIAVPRAPTVPVHLSNNKPDNKS